MDNSDFLHLLDRDMDKISFQELVSKLNTEQGREQLSEQMDVLLNRLESEDTSDLNQQDRDKVYQDISHRIRLKIIRKRILQAGVASIVFCIGFASSYIRDYLDGDGSGNLKYETITVKDGEHPLHLIFQDGTKVTINSGSQFSFPQSFHKNERTVSLNGEAYFEVSSDKSRPFSVNLGSSTVTVKGTHFNVKNYPTDSLTKVTLEEGCVEFVCDKGSYRLLPNQEIIYNRISGDVPTVQYRSTSERNSLWREGIIAFDKTPLIEVLNTIKRMYGVDYNVTDDLAYSYTYNYTSKKSTRLENLLEDLQRISDIEFILEENCIEVKRNY